MYFSIIFSSIGARFAIFYKGQTKEFENWYNILDTDGMIFLKVYVILYKM